MRMTAEHRAELAAMAKRIVQILEESQGEPADVPAWMSARDAATRAQSHDEREQRIARGECPEHGTLLRKRDGSGFCVRCQKAYS